MRSRNIFRKMYCFHVLNSIAFTTPKYLVTMTSSNANGKNFSPNINFNSATACMQRYRKYIHLKILVYDKRERGNEATLAAIFSSKPTPLGNSARTLSSLHGAAQIRAFSVVFYMDNDLPFSLRFELWAETLTTSACV